MKIETLAAKVNNQYIPFWDLVDVDNELYYKGKPVVLERVMFDTVDCTFSSIEPRFKPNDIVLVKTKGVYIKATILKVLKGVDSFYYVTDVRKKAYKENKIFEYERG